MIHEYNCKRCGKRDWHYVDDCTGDHPRYCQDCENDVGNDPLFTVDIGEDF